MEEKKKNSKKVILIILGIIIFLVGLCIGLFFMLKSPVSGKEISMEFIVKEGQSYGSIADDLKENKLIRNTLMYKVYLKILAPTNLEAGKYYLSPSMDVEDIINTLESGAQEDRKTTTITFVEGKNMRYVIGKITENFNITEEEIIELLSNEEFLDELISKHWILSDSIKDENIYYSLEGYLYPDTYEFYADATLEEIIEKMISNLETKLNNYKAEIENSGYSFHEMLTLASIIEQEAGSSKDRKGVAGVFYNRLEDNWSLGSDVTTYYAEKIELWSRYLYRKEINNCNSYNTRASCMAGKLPVGPICNPGVNSVISAIEPTDHDYYYFVADIYGETYFNESNTGHEQTVAKLKSEGKWYEY